MLTYDSDYRGSKGTSPIKIREKVIRSRNASTMRPNTSNIKIKQIGTGANLSSKFETGNVQSSIILSDYQIKNHGSIKMQTVKHRSVHRRNIPGLLSTEQTGTIKTSSQS